MFRAQLLSVRYITLAAALLAPGAAHALEPLGAFVQSSRSYAFDNREAEANARQRRAETTQSWLKLVPTVQASAAYTANQYEASVSIPGPNPINAVITPQNQYDFIFSASVPLVDVGAWERIGVAKRNEEAATARVSSTALDVQRTVAQAYYQVVADEAVLESAKERNATSQANLDYVRTRHDAGVATDLDYKRASSELERTLQDIADAEYNLRVARRNLATASGKDPSPGGVTLSEDLSEEAPLGSWSAGLDSLPAVRAAHADTLYAERNASATRAALFPTVNASATERVTNAVGFGQSPYYTFVFTALWRFDASVIAGGAAADDAAAASRVREDRTRRQADDAIYTDYQAVVRNIEKTRAAKADREASDLAAKLARQRYEAGTATYLDLLTAERDDFVARVSYIQAAADLAYARVALRLAAGRPIGGGS